MRIGIIVYSHTGNTLSVAQRLEKTLNAKGHAASVARVEPAEADPQARPVRLKTAPDVAPYDAVVFATPVYAFSLPMVMKLYLNGISSLSGKRVSCFVTQGLKKKWLGGNHTIRQIKSACAAKGATVAESGIVLWTGDRREEQITELVNRLGAI